MIKFNQIFSFLVALILIVPMYAIPPTGIQIYGVPKDIEKNILLRLDIYKQYKKSKLSKLSSEELMHNTKLAIEPFGYFKSKIKVSTKKIMNKNYWIIKIKLGPPTKITKIDIVVTGDGVKNPELLDLVKIIPIKKGDIFHAKIYDKAKDSLTTWCNKNGFFQAKFTTNTVSVNKEKNSCQILLKLDTGKQFFFGQINILGSTLRPRFIRKYLPFSMLHPFNPDQLIEAQNALAQSNYFKTINISPQYEHINDNIIPINVFLELEKQVQIQAGIGYGSDTKFEGYTNFNFRYVNTYGHKFKTNFDLSQVTQGIAGGYIIPGKNPTTDEYQILSKFKAVDVDIGYSKNAELGIHSTTNFLGWSKTLSLSYLIESYRIKDEKYNRTTLLIPQIVLLNRHVDDNTFPESGAKFTFKLNGSNKHLLSKLSFYKATAQFDHIYPLWWFRIITKNKIGSIIINDIDKLPFSQNFLEGGPNSVRGYKLKSIGPGKFMFLSSVDVQIPLGEKWFISPFIDIGNVYNYTHEKMKTSVGISIMRKTPIGPISFGVAKAWQKNAPKIRIVFNLGPEM